MSLKKQEQTVLKVPQGHAWILRFCRRLRRHCHHCVVVIDAIDVIVVFFVVVLKTFWIYSTCGRRRRRRKVGFLWYLHDVYCVKMLHGRYEVSSWNSLAVGTFWSYSTSGRRRRRRKVGFLWCLHDVYWCLVMFQTTKRWIKEILSFGFFPFPPSSSSWCDILRYRAAWGS